MNSTVLLLPSHEIAKLVDLDELRDLMASVLRTRVPLDDTDPQRFAIKTGKGLLGIMAGGSEGLSLQGVKTVSLNKGHSGIYTLFDSNTGETKAILEAGTLTGLRTAAVSAAVSELMVGRDSVSHIGVLGSGRQAHFHLHAFASLYPQARFQVFTRSQESFKALVAPFPMSLQERIRHFSSPAEAAKNSQVICTLTRSVLPLLDVNMVPDVCHINAVGSCHPNHRELSGSLVKESVRFVDSLPAAKREAGDLLLANLQKDLFGIEIGELFRDSRKIPKGQRTLFKSLGMAIEDLAFAKYVTEKAQR